MASEPVRIVGGRLELEVLPEHGARVHRIRAFGTDLLRTPDRVATHFAEPFSWGGYVMAPWCNRISATPTPVHDRVVRLTSNIADGSAIHGQVYERPWEVLGPGRFGTRGGGDGWPWRYEVRLEVGVDGGVAGGVAESRLRMKLALTNLDAVPMPAGIGWHPWFVEPVEVRIPASAVYHSNLASSSRAEPVAGPYDRRKLGPLAQGLDATWTDLDDGALELIWPVAGISGELRARGWLEAPGHAAGSAIALSIVAANLGAGAVAVEPQTHAPQGLRRLLAGEPNAMCLLEPGATLRLEIILVMRRGAGTGQEVLKHDPLHAGLGWSP